MKKSTIAVATCLSLAASGARAADWSINSTLSQTVEANDNPFLQAVAGGALRSYSTIIANAVARMPTSKFLFDGSVGYTKYWGPGVDGQQSENLTGSAHFRYEWYGKTTGDREYVEAGWHRSSSAFALLGELGVVTPVRGFIDRSTVGAGIDRSLTALDAISLSAHTTYTSYDPGGGGVPFNDASADATWKHQVSHLATIVVSSDPEFLHFDNILNTDVTLLRESAGVEATLSPLLSFRGSAGGIYVQTDRGAPLSSTVPVTPSTAVSSASNDFIANAVLTYKMFADTTLTLNAAQNIGPSAYGTLIKSRLVGAGLSYQVNRRETLSFAASASQTTSSGVTSDFLSTSITYSYLLTKQWTAQLAYRYLHRFASTSTFGFTVDPLTGIPIPLVNTTGPADSNSIMLVVSRSVTVLPDGY